MCKSVTRKIAISSRCNFVLYGIDCITNELYPFAYLLMNINSLTINSAFYSYIEFDDVFVHVRTGMSEELRLIQEFIKSFSPPRVIVLVDNAHAPTLKLLRAMGVFFIFSLHDSLRNIVLILQDPSMPSYMSPDLYTVIKDVQPPPTWAMEWNAFDGVQHLTSTETQIILDLIQGVSPWKVASKRCVSVKTISTHKLNALRKIEIRGLNELFITTRR